MDLEVDNYHAQVDGPLLLFIIQSKVVASTCTANANIESKRRSQNLSSTDHTYPWITYTPR